MKRIYKILLFSILVSAVPFSLASGQEKKTENKIIIVTDDGSGAETVLDTTITSGELPKTITLKNGRVIFLGESGTIIKPDSLNGKVFVTVTSSGDGEKEKKQKIVFMTGDSISWTVASDDDVKNYVYTYSGSKNKEGKPGSYIAVTSKDMKEGEKKIEKKIIIKDGKAIKETGDNKIDVFIESDYDSDTEATEYIIARDGVVVTIKGNDEARVKDLAREIEEKLGIKSDEKGEKETGTVKSGKSVKK